MLAVPFFLQAASAPDVTPDITIVGNKLKKLQLSLAMDDGTLKTCTIKVSSGDTLIDRLACESAHTCIEQRVADTNTLMDCIDQDITAAVRRRNNGKESDDAQD